MRVGVTGAAGHVGTSICNALIQSGYEVNALVFRDIASLKNLPVQLIYGNILDKKSLASFMRGCNYIIHAAAAFSFSKTFDQYVYDVNVVGTRNVLESARENGIKRVVYISSIQVYSTNHSGSINESCQFVQDGESIYDTSKRDGHILTKEASNNRIETIIVCPTSVFGPPDSKPSRIGRAMIDLYQGKFPAVFRGGFDFVDVRDVALGTIKAMEMGKNGESYILGGKYATLKEFADIVQKIRGKRRKIIELPTWLPYLILPFIKYYAKLTKTQPLFEKSYIDILKQGNKGINSEKAYKELGYRTRDMKHTIQDTLQYFQTEGKKLVE